MITDDAIFSQLENECQRLDRSTSSHWQNYLVGFRYHQGQFESTGLPEGGGVPKCSPLKRAIHSILQSPYKIKGYGFRGYRDFISIAEELHRRRGTTMDLATLRQALTLSLLDDRIAIRKMREPIVVIGDGFGVFASLIFFSRGGNQGKIVVVNLTQNLLVDAVYLKIGIPDVRMCLVKTGSDYIKALRDDRFDILLVQADNYAVIGSGPIGMAVNIVSMQEMELDVIRGYFDAIRSSINDTTYFYCCNREEKTLIGGPVIRFNDYPWSADDKIIFDEICPWHKYYYDQHLPFYHSYDGSIRHKLAIMRKV